MKKKLLAIIIMLCLTVSVIGTTALAYAEMEVTVDGISMVLNSEYDASIIPDGFYEVAHEYNGETYYGGTDDVTDLYFIRCDSDSRRTGWYTLQNGNFVLYQNLDGETSIDSGSTDTQDTEAPSTATLTGSTIYSREMGLQIAVPAVGTEIPSGYTETTVAADNDYVTAYQKEDATGASAEAYLVYGTVDGYNFGWYVYDQSQETIQRYMNNAEAQVVDQQEDIIDELKLELSDLNTKYNNDIGKSKNLFIIACIAAVLFLFLMINAMIKRKHTEKDLEDRIIDLKENHGEETQIFTKGEQKRFDRMDSAARDRADRKNDRYSTGDEYKYPEYGENRRNGADAGNSERYSAKRDTSNRMYEDEVSGQKINGDRAAQERIPVQRADSQRVSSERTDMGRRPSDRDLSDRGRSGMTTSSRNVNKPVVDEDNYYFDDDQDDFGAEGGMRVIEEDFDDRRSDRKPVQKDTGSGQSSYSEKTSVNSVKSPRTERERAQDSYSRTETASGRESLFVNVSEDTRDIGMALKQAKSDKGGYAPSGETRDFDLDLLEKNLGKMTSDILDGNRTTDKSSRSISYDRTDSISRGNNVRTDGRSTRVSSFDVSEISNDHDFETDFIDL